MRLMKYLLSQNWYLFSKVIQTNKRYYFNADLIRVFILYGVIFVFRGFRNRRGIY